MKPTVRPIFSAVIIACGAAGLTGCDLFRPKAPEVTVADTDPPPPAPKPPDPPKPEKPQPPPRPPEPPDGSIPTARPVPGRPGFVFSPYNNKLIDVEGFPSGRLVADPHYPASERKYFRVP